MADIVTYGDNKKHRRTVCIAEDGFREFAFLVRRMLPACEAVPGMIMTEEDWENEE